MKKIIAVFVLALFFLGNAQSVQKAPGKEYSSKKGKDSSSKVVGKECCKKDKKSCSTKKK